MVRDVAQLLRPHRERNSTVLVPEECGIGKPRAHHPLVALPDLRRVAAFDVAHRDEAAGQPPVFALDRKVPLVILNRRDHHFARQLEKARLEAAGNGHRPFHESRDLIEQAVLDEGASAGRLGRRDHTGAHRFAALAEIGNHLRAREPLLVAAR